MAPTDVEHLNHLLYLLILILESRQHFFRRFRKEHISVLKEHLSTTPGRSYLMYCHLMGR